MLSAFPYEFFSLKHIQRIHIPNILLGLHNTNDNDEEGENNNNNNNNNNNLDEIDFSSMECYFILKTSPYENDNDTNNNSNNNEEETVLYQSEIRSHSIHPTFDALESGPGNRLALYANAYRFILELYFPLLKQPSSTTDTPPKCFKCVHRRWMHCQRSRFLCQSIADADIALHQLHTVGPSSQTAPVDRDVLQVVVECADGVYLLGQEDPSSSSSPRTTVGKEMERKESASSSASSCCSTPSSANKAKKESEKEVPSLDWTRSASGVAHCVVENLNEKEEKESKTESVGVVPSFLKNFVSLHQLRHFTNAALMWTNLQKMKALERQDILQRLEEEHETQNRTKEYNERLVLTVREIIVEERKKLLHEKKILHQKLQKRKEEAKQLLMVLREKTQDVRPNSSPSHSHSGYEKENSPCAPSSHLSDTFNEEDELAKVEKNIYRYDQERLSLLTHRASPEDYARLKQTLLFFFFPIDLADDDAYGSLRCKSPTAEQPRHRGKDYLQGLPLPVLVNSPTAAAAAAPIRRHRMIAGGESNAILRVEEKWTPREAGVLHEENTALGYVVQCLMLLFSFATSYELDRNHQHHVTEMRYPFVFDGAQSKILTSDRTWLPLYSASHKEHDRLQLAKGLVLLMENVKDMADRFGIGERIEKECAPLRVGKALSILLS